MKVEILKYTFPRVTSVDDVDHVDTRQPRIISYELCIGLLLSTITAMQYTPSPLLCMPMTNTRRVVDALFGSHLSDYFEHNLHL